MPVMMVDVKPLSPRLKAMYENKFTLEYHKAMKLQNDGEVEILPFDMAKKLTKQKVIYTAIYGSKDRLPQYPSFSSDYDYVCFTDNKKLMAENWTVIYREGVSSDPTRSARWLKTHPHKLFPNHARSVWVDANIRFKTGYLQRLYAASGNFVGLQHWQEVKGVYDEARRCIMQSKDDPKTIEKQCARYRSEGLPELIDILWTALLIRNHNEQNIVEFDEMWWDEINKGSRRDQLSFPYCVWKLKMPYVKIKGFGNFFKRLNHLCPSN